MFVPKPKIFIITFMLFQPLPILTLLWPLISMGFITNLLALSNYNSILVVVDLLMKIIHIIFYAKIVTSEKIFKLFFVMFSSIMASLNIILVEFTSKF
jgi:hypothetical protein